LNKEKYKKIGYNISACRRAQGLTQEKLADKVGMSISYLAKIEAPNTRKSFSLEVLFEISDALQTPVSILMDGV